MRDAVFDKIVLDGDQIQTDLFIDDMQLTAADQNRIHIQHMRVKAVARVRGRAAVFIHAVGCDIPLTEAAQVTVLQHNALGNAGGARCIEHDEQIARIGIFGELLRVGQLRDLVGIKHGAVVVRELVHEVPVGDQILRVGVPDHEFQTLRRITRVERLITRARLQHAESGDGHIFTARNDDGNRLIGTDALALEERRDILGQTVDLFVSIAAVKIDDRDTVGRLCRASAEQCDDVRDLVIMLKMIDLLQPFGGFVIHQLNLSGIFFFGEFEQGLLVCRDHIPDKILGEALHRISDMIGEPVTVRIDQQFDLCLLFVKGKVDALCRGAAEIKRPAVGHRTLIREQYVGCHAELAADLRKGIYVIAQTVGKLSADLLNEFTDRLIVALTVYGIGANKHGHAVSEARIVSSVVDGGENSVLSAAVFAEQPAERGGTKRVFTDVMSGAVIFDDG